MTYRESIKSILISPERRLFEKLSSPQKIQDYLDTLPINFERSGETYMSPRRVLRAGTAHCFEGALLAAAAFAYYGRKPLLMDLGTISADEDHVVALFRVGRFWGAISKTNHPILRYRDPVYASARELALSYFNEYFTQSGAKSLRSYSAPFDLSKYPPEKWVTDGGNLHNLVEALDESRHFPIAAKKNMRALRRASQIERCAVEVTEWNARGVRIARKMPSQR